MTSSEDVIRQNEKYEAIVRHFDEEFRKEDAELLRPLFTDDVIHQNGPQPPEVGIEDFMKEVARWFKLIPGPPFTIGFQEIAVTGDTVLTICEGDMVSPITGLAVKVPCVGVYKIRDGKICYWRDYYDRINTLSILGTQVADSTKNLTPDDIQASAAQT